MGEVEKLNRYLNQRRDIKWDLEDIKQEIQCDWGDYKHSRLILHGEQVQDNKMDMLLLYLIKKGIIGQRE